MKFKSGDTLSAIAVKNGTTVAKLMAANPNIKNKNSIQAGASYNLPPKNNNVKASTPNLNIRSSNKKSSDVSKTNNQPLGSGKTSFIESELSKMTSDAKKAFKETKRNLGIKSSTADKSSSKPSWFDKIIKETKRNFNIGQDKSAPTKGTSNIIGNKNFVSDKKKKPVKGPSDYKPGSYKSGYSEMGSGVREAKKSTVPVPKLKPENIKNKNKKKKLSKQMSA